MSDREYLNPIYVDAHTLPEAWFMLQKKIWELNSYEYKVAHGSYIGMIRREFDHVTCRIRRPDIRPLCETMFPSNCTFAPPTTPDQVEQYFNNYLMNSIVPEGTYYTYAERLVPQLLEVIRRYQTWGFRHAKASMSIAKPDDILMHRLPANPGDPIDPDSRASEPCLREVTWKIRWDNISKVWRLHMYIYFRVWDLFGGFPENLAGFQLVKEFMVKEIGPEPETGLPLEDGEMIVASPSLNVREHIFKFSKQVAGLEE